MPDLNITYAITYIHPHWYIVKCIGEERKTLELHFGTRREATLVAKYLATQKNHKPAGSAFAISTPPEGDVA
jgi:hypothetical protein